MNFRQFLRSLWKSLGRPPAPKPAPRPAPTPAPPRPAPVPPSPGDKAAQLLAEHNARRSEAGLSEWVSSVKLQAAAQGHAITMAQFGRMAHSGIGDGDLGSRLRGVGYAFRAAGENIAWDQGGVAAVMGLWMNSPGHRANILSPAFAEAGFAVAYSARGDAYYCSDFGTPAIAGRGAYATSAYVMGTPEVTGDGRRTASSVAVAAD